MKKLILHKGSLFFFQPRRTTHPKHSQRVIINGSKHHLFSMAKRISAMSFTSPFKIKPLSTGGIEVNILLLPPLRKHPYDASYLPVIISAWY